jgi:hypothetical protein
MPPPGRRPGDYPESGATRRNAVPEVPAPVAAALSPGRQRRRRARFHDESGQPSGQMSDCRQRSSPLPSCSSRLIERISAEVLQHRSGGKGRETWAGTSRPSTFSGLRPLRRAPRAPVVVKSQPVSAASKAPYIGRSSKVGRVPGRCRRGVGRNRASVAQPPGVHHGRISSAFDVAGGSQASEVSRSRPQGAVIAHCVRETGQREILGIDVGEADTEALERVSQRSGRTRPWRRAAGDLRRARRPEGRYRRRCSAPERFSSTRSWR